MSSRYARIPIITEPVEDITELIDVFNFRIDEFNRVLHELELEQAKAKGDDSNIPSFNNNLNLNDNRITTVGRSKDPKDVVTRRELEEVGILGSRAGGLTIRGDLTVDGTISVEGPTGGSGEVSTGADVDSAIADALDAEVATSQDGDVYDREDGRGVNGATSGTVAMGVDGEGKVRPVELRNGEIPMRDDETRTLLVLILEQLEKLNNAD